MFRSKKTEKNGDVLIEEIEKLKSEYANKKAEEMDRLRELKDELHAAVDQHEKVNAQHTVLGDAVTEIEKKFDNVGELSEQSTEKSNELYEKGYSLEEKAQRMVEEATEGTKEVHATADVIKELGNQIQSSEKNMSNLSERSVEIQSIVGVIEDIAAQTNLLALNASIEAARAGESGKGFAVVAQEVRKLAESTSDSTANIQTLTNALRDEIEQALAATKKSAALIEKGITVSMATAEKMERILGTVEESKIDITAIQEMIEEQKKLAERVKMELSDANSLFSEAHALIVDHIDDAKEVDLRLENGIRQLSFS
ncbi:methyl-accepting chemotaxis protein [Sporosarcina contaminans]|uniref:Methyl-accepting chemotaxis protein n=1 Tax=Sporosarcina contaminans TaxID=633403 RepID=A0ABW3TXN1_9BACL